jgi:hypothetical protein
VSQNGSVASSNADNSALTSEVISIFGEHMPSDPSNPGFSYLQGFMSLRLLLLRTTRTPQEQDVVDTILSSYSSYKAGGRTRPDMALMLARDFMFLNQQNQNVPQQQNIPQQHTHQTQMPQCQMNGHQQQQAYHAGNNAAMQTQYQYVQNAAPAPMMGTQPHPPVQEASAYAQPAQQYPQQQNNEYWNMNDMEPPPLNHGQSAASSPLTVAVENVESLLSPENAPSNA